MIYKCHKIFTNLSHHRNFISIYWAFVDFHKCKTAPYFHSQNSSTYELSGFRTSKYSIRQKLMWYLVPTYYNNRVIVFFTFLDNSRLQSSRMKLKRMKKYVSSGDILFIGYTTNWTRHRGPSHWIIKGKKWMNFAFRSLSKNEKKRFEVNDAEMMLPH